MTWKRTIGRSLHNFILLLVQIFIISWITLLCLKIGEKAINAWLCVVAIAMNLLILKEIRLCGFHVTAVESLGVSYILGLNLMQEYYGKTSARTHVMIAAICTFGFVILQQLHMVFEPDGFDKTQVHYSAIFDVMPMLTSVSFISFIFIQILDIKFFSWLQQKIGAKKLTLRIIISLMMSQTIDTLVFYGLLSFAHIWSNVFHIIIFTLIIKFIVIFLIAPYTGLARLFVSKEVMDRKSFLRQ